MRLASAGLNNRSLVLENSGQQPVGEPAARVRTGRSPYHRHKRVCRATLVAAGLFVAGSSLSAQHATAFDIEDGGRAFRNTCANCHGPDGDQIAVSISAAGSSAARCPTRSWPASFEMASRIHRCPPPTCRTRRRRRSSQHARPEVGIPHERHHLGRRIDDCG